MYTPSFSIVCCHKREKFSCLLECSHSPEKERKEKIVEILKYFFIFYRSKIKIDRRTFSLNNFHPIGKIKNECISFLNLNLLELQIINMRSCDTRTSYIEHRTYSIDIKLFRMTCARC